MFSQFIAPIEIEVESEALPRSLDCAARRAKLRRGGKNRAATLGMTEQEKAHSQEWLCHGSASLRAGGMTEKPNLLRAAPPWADATFCHPERSSPIFSFVRAARTSATERGTAARSKTQHGSKCRQGNPSVE